MLTFLNNGMRFVHMPHQGEVCRCALVINAGSRDEAPDEPGLAHFVEHALFKGTERRAAHHILSRLDAVGGELNAYTTKDETAIHAAFLPEYLDRAAELIADMAFRSTFPDKELDKERDVIVDEITSYQDSPAELIFDEFEDEAFQGNPLGHNILGTPDAVARFKGEDAARFVGTNHTTDQMAFVFIGNVPQSKVERVAQRHFGSVTPSARREPRASALSFRLFDKVLSKSTSQAHVVLGTKAPGRHDEERVELNVLANILGGPSMNSRLSVALRERHGIAYNVETNYNAFDDVGVFSIYYGTDAQNLEKSARIVSCELERLTQSALSPAQFASVMRQYTGQLLMSADDAESLMLAAGRSAIAYGKVLSVPEIVRMVREKVTAGSLLDVAQKYLNPKGMSRLTYN